MGLKELSKPKKSKKPRNIVSFDEEIVTKGDAANHLAESSKIFENEHKTKNSNNKVKQEKPHENNNGTVHVPEVMSIERKENVKKNKKRKQESERNEKLNEECNIGQTALLEMKSKKQKKNQNPEEVEIKLDPEQKEVEQNSSEIKSKKQKKNKKSDKLETKLDSKENELVEQDTLTEVQNKKRKKNKKSNEPETKPDPEENEEISTEKPKTKKEVSIRAQKRMKHEKLLAEKRLKVATATQQNVLNYLSKWKHARDEWKFEKLKQIWLQQNLFDCSKIPNEFWDTAVEYFSGSKGFIRNCVLRDALKIIEKAESSREENVSENDQLVLKRAQDVIQNLQE